MLKRYKDAEEEVKKREIEIEIARRQQLDMISRQETIRLAEEKKLLEDEH